jgi:chemotaxis regulatin CheY-phosphate phosphatase CheZ
MSASPVALATNTFETLEKAIRETTRGQSFLEEYGRRVRAGDTDRTLGAISELKAVLTDTVTSASLDVLRRELETMAASIAQTRREIASIRPEGPGHNRIVTATEELDHVLRSTEQATSEILGTAERIQEIVGELKAKGVSDPLCDELDTHGTNLMMACSFQDLTGQRMTKVVNTLRYLETRVNAMIEIWGITAEEAERLVNDETSNDPDAHLLNGPARRGEGVAQDDIDRLLKAEDETPPVAATGDGRAASQDDIDALFR